MLLKYLCYCIWWTQLTVLLTASDRALVLRWKNGPLHLCPCQLHFDEHHYINVCVFQSSTRPPGVTFQMNICQERRLSRRSTIPNGPSPAVENVSTFYGVCIFTFILYLFFLKCHFLCFSLFSYYVCAVVVPRVSKTWSFCPPCIWTRWTWSGRHARLAFWFRSSDRLHLLFSLGPGYHHLLWPLLLLFHIRSGVHIQSSYAQTRVFEDWLSKCLILAVCVYVLILWLLDERES